MVLLLQPHSVVSWVSHCYDFDTRRSPAMSTNRGQHLIGQVIGSYILEKLLGYGGSSAVFLAQNRLTNEKVAVKVFLPRSTMDKHAQKNFYKRFLREAEATSELDHPNILSIYSYGQHNGLPYIVMSYMSGGTLSEYVTRHGPLPLSQAEQYLEQIASALDYAHENGRMHCDITPQIDRVIAKALSKWPEDRYQTAGMFSVAFSEAVANADNYVLTDSEAKMKATVSRGGAKKAKAPLKPTSQGNPTWKASNKL